MRSLAYVVNVSCQAFEMPKTEKWIYKNITELKVKAISLTKFVNETKNLVRSTWIN